MAPELRCRQMQASNHRPIQQNFRPTTNLVGRTIGYKIVGKVPDSDKDTNTVRGVANSSTIPPVEIDGKNLGCESLSTDCRRMGRDADGHESYTRGVLRLLEHYGPFRLAFFEAVFRAADIRASIAASREHNA